MWHTDTDGYPAYFSCSQLFFLPLIPISGHLRLIWKPVSRISYDLELNVSLYSQSNKPHMLTFTLMHFFIHVPLCYSMKIEPVDVYTVCRFEKWYSLFGTDSSHGSWNKEWSFLESTFKDFNSVKHIYSKKLITFDFLKTPVLISHHHFKKSYIYDWFK